MAQEKIEDLSTEKLLKRKKFSNALLILLLIVAIIDFTLFLYDLIRDDNFNTSLLVSVGALIVVGMPVLIGRKKILEELEGRERP